MAYVTVLEESRTVPEASGKAIALGAVAVEEIEVALAPLPSINPEAAVAAVKIPVTPSVPPTVELLVTARPVPLAPNVAGALTVSAFALLPMVTRALVVPVPILTAKLEDALRFTVAPVAVNPNEPLISPEALMAAAVVVPVIPRVPPTVTLLVTAKAVLAALKVVAPVKVFAEEPVWVYPASFRRPPPAIHKP